MIGGRELRTGDCAQAVMPHDHGHVLADWHRATTEHVQQAIEAAAAAARRVGELAVGGPRWRCS